MKKKYLLTCFTAIFVFLIFAPKSKAVVCRYSSEGTNVTYEFEIENEKAKRGVIKGFDGSKVNKEDVLNWDNTADGLFLYTGEQNYRKNLDCPHYAIVYVEKIDLIKHYKVVVLWDDKDSFEHRKIMAYLKQKKIIWIHDLKWEGYVEPEPKEPEKIEKPVYSSCIDFPSSRTCKRSGEYGYACVWNEEDGYCNVDNLQYVACGDAYDIPHEIPELTSFLVNLLKIIAPIILIIIGIITLFKALTASNEEEINKAKKSLTKKLIAAVMVFFVITIVQFVIRLVADNERKSLNSDSEVNNISSCFSCFLNNDCKEKYYRAVVAGEDVCKKVSDGTIVDCK